MIVVHVLGVDQLASLCYIFPMRTLVLLYFLAMPSFVIAQQPSAPEKIYPIGNGVTPPKPLYTPQPEFTKKARKKKIQGTVIVEGYVGTDGKFHNGKVVRPVEKGLDANALAAVNRWTFFPCTKEGQAVNCTMKVEVSYNLYQRD